MMSECGDIGEMWVNVWGEKKCNFFGSFIFRNETVRHSKEKRK